MDDKTLLLHQTKSAYQWVDTLLQSTPADRWAVIPDGLDSCIAWQAGHLVVSYYFHAIMVVRGHQPDILQAMPLKDYDAFFTRGKPKDSIGAFSPGQLMEHMAMVARRSLEIIEQLPPAMLQQALIPTPYKHPVASTRQEALSWNIKHAMWHCGQIAMLKRVVDKPYEFRLEEV